MRVRSRHVRIDQEPLNLSEQRLVGHGRHEDLEAPLFEQPSMLLEPNAQHTISLADIQERTGSLKRVITDCQVESWPIVRQSRPLGRMFGQAPLFQQERPTPLELNVSLS
jgi:hypothetical protein